ncbi:MAG: sigma factor-like helix-turn-helix DNA-binding protein, partial [Nocardioidaceae bacterium]
MGREEEFDSFYHATRRAMVHQAFALTGDLSAAQAAVRDAYVAAWHHWRKASAFADPQDWVRPRAWQLAQRRHTARLLQRTKSISAEHKALLDAVTKLPMTQRRILLLTLLAGLPISETARELGLSPQLAEQQLHSATAKLAEALGADPSSLRARLLSLDEATSIGSLPRVSIIRRAGRKRRRTHTVIAAAAVAFLSIGAGAFAYEPSGVQASVEAPLIDQEDGKEKASAPAEEPEPTDDLPTAEQMLGEKQIERLDGGRWRVTATHDNTTGSGIHSVCQQARFADPDGLSAVVRTFEAAGKPRRSAVQTLEISKSTDQAEKAFATMVGWFAGCEEGPVQLLSTYRVNGVGDRATVLMVRSWSRPVTSFSVAVAQVGQVVTSTVSKTNGTSLPGTTRVVRSLAQAVDQLCEKSDETGCSGRPSYAAAPPPDAGDSEGMLSAVDLPHIAAVTEPWVGTKPLPARPNPSATTCDHANFVREGAVKTRAKYYLIPQSKLPDRFGLSETYGTFRSESAAGKFLDGVRNEVGGCEDRDLATEVTSAHSGSPGAMSLSTWTFVTEISDNASVVFRVGLVRVGKHVAQVTFSPTDGADVSDEGFR